MNVSAIITEWSALYRKGQASVADLMNMLRYKSETEALFPIRYTESTIMERSSASFSRVLQRFQKAFTPTGAATFEPRKIPLHRLKIDIQETPDDLVETWLGFLASENTDRTTWPFIKWWLKQAIDQAAQDLEKNEIFYGVLGSITPGTANTAGNNMLGLRKQIRDGVTDGDVNNLAMGAVPTDPVDFVVYMEEMRKALPTLIRDEIDMFVMSKDHAELFAEGMDLKYNTNYMQVPNIMTIKRSNIAVKGVESHQGSDMIWATPKFNRQGGYKATQNETVFEVEKVDRTVKAYTDYHKGFGFWIPEYVYTNGEDLS